jgi:predicted TIM-barrel fold metal-dependent hydrolase
MTAPWNTDAPIEPYLRRARRAGIQKTVVFAPFHSNYDEANRQVARIVARFPERLVGFAFVHAVRDAGRIFCMVQRARKWGFLGIKLHGFEAMPTREVCEAARAFRMPLLADVVGRAEVIDMLAPQFPDVNFIIPHLGSFADDWRAHQRVIEQIVRSQCLYRYFGGATLRLHRRGDQACRRKEDSFRFRWAVAASWARVAQDSIAPVACGSGSVDPGRKHHPFVARGALAR